MSSLNIVVVDYGAGNLRSVAKALEKAGVTPRVTSDPREVAEADALILPGVGAGDAAMRAIRGLGLAEPIKGFIASGRPFLGVCLGLQLLMEVTEEGEAECLGIVRGRVRRLPEGLKVPHMGWNQVEFRKHHPLFEGIPQGAHFYFVHSYYADPEDPSLVAGVTEYGIPFCSAIARGSLVATQFHPEKSGQLGLRIYQNFVRFAVEGPAWR
jgi:glutamine amidotransferase